MWSLADGSCLRTLEGHLASVLRLDFLSAGTQVLTAGADGLIKLWSLRLSGGEPAAATEEGGGSTACREWGGGGGGSNAHGSFPR